MENLEEAKKAALATLDRSLKAPYFFKRGDGEIFAVDEKQAWEHIRGQGNWARRDFTYLGRSDGSAFNKIMREAKGKFDELNKDINKIRKDIVKFLKTEERLRFDEVLPEDDEKVLRVKAEIEKLENKLEPMEEDLNNFSKNVYQKAFNAELKVAKLDKGIPENKDIITPEGNRKKILRQLSDL